MRSIRELGTLEFSFLLMPLTAGFETFIYSKRLLFGGKFTKLKKYNSSEPVSESEFDISCL